VITKKLKEVKKMEQIKKFVTGANLPRFIILTFFLAILFLAVAIGMPLGSLMTDTLVRFGMNGILVLAMVPAIQSGIGPNFGLPIGIIAGLIGALISFQMELSGFVGFLAANLIALPFAVISGIVFGIMLNRIKGSEMIVSTYTGFSIVSLMSIGWVIMPFTNGEMVWPIGKGLRNVITLESYYGKLLDDFLSIKFIKLPTGESLVLFNKSVAYLQNTYGNDFSLRFAIPTGLILFFFLLSYLVLLFINSKTGVALKAAGDNPSFAKASGINVDKARIIGTTVSTVLASTGIIVYSQSYGFIQLYQAPLMMAFPAVAAILIGGASAQKAKISHVIIGTFLFNGLLTISLPVANQILPEGNLSEVIRMIVQNGVILYALTKVGGSE
jgi:simple sugar transport system permease protein